MKKSVSLKKALQLLLGVVGLFICLSLLSAFRVKEERYPRNHGSAFTVNPFSGQRICLQINKGE